MKRAWLRICNRIATAFLLVLLAAISVLASACDKEEPKAYYGPAPVDDSSGDATVDVAVYYGPMPVDSITPDTDVLDNDNTAVYYGPLDLIDDGDVADTGQTRMHYGPLPVDAVEDDAALYYGPLPADVVDARDTSDNDGMMIMYGPNPLDVSPEDCEPMAAYGPPPCTSDAECVTDYGQGWYCDQENTVDPGCGQPYTWPVCKPK